MRALRTWFGGGEILTEFFPPYLGNKNKSSNRVIIFCSGVPCAPASTRRLEYWSRKGYWVFQPRYRGTWESRGVFMEIDPTQDVIDIIDGLGGPILDEWNRIEYRCNIQRIFVCGGSFGGAAALFASIDERVDKVVAVSPVIDWLAPNADEPLERWPEMVGRSFGMAYRSTNENWGKLRSGVFYNPIKRVDQFDGNKIMIVHALDDAGIRAKEVVEFAKNTGAKLYMLKKGGHMPISLASWRWARKIERFFYKR